MLLVFGDRFLERYLGLDEPTREKPPRWDLYQEEERSELVPFLSTLCHVTQ